MERVHDCISYSPGANRIVNDRRSSHKIAGIIKFEATIPGEEIKSEWDLMYLVEMIGQE